MPGVWHGYDDCQHLALFNCCFSGDLLRRELAWTREDALLGYLLWTGSYSAQGRGVLTTRLDAADLAEVRSAPVGDRVRFGIARSPSIEATSSAACPCCSVTWAGQLPGSRAPMVGAIGPTHPAVGHGHAATRRPDRLPLVADRTGRAAAPGSRLPGAPVQGHHRPAADGLPCRLRAENAATLLLDSDQPIAHVGQAVGWPDQNYFARRFKSPLRPQCQYLPGAVHAQRRAAAALGSLAERT